MKQRAHALLLRPVIWRKRLLLEKWRQLEPESTLVDRMLSSVLLRGGRLEEAGEIFERVLENTNASRGLVFLQISQMVASHQDKAAALALMQALAEPYPEVPEAHWSLAHLAHMAGNNEMALQHVERAMALNPDWMMATSLHIRVLRAVEPARALRCCNSMQQHPDCNEMRLQYARELLEQKHYQAASEQFVYLAEKRDDPDMWFAAAMVSLQLEQLDDAEQQLLTAIKTGKRDRETVDFSWLSYMRICSVRMRRCSII